MAARSDYTTYRLLSRPRSYQHGCKDPSKLVAMAVEVAIKALLTIPAINDDLLHLMMRKHPVIPS